MSHLALTRCVDIYFFCSRIVTLTFSLTLHCHVNVNIHVNKTLFSVGYVLKKHVWCFNYFCCSRL